MNWNYRIIETEENGEIFLNIHEVYYDKDGTPNGYTENPVTVNGEVVEDLKWVLNKMIECLDKPILLGGEKFPQEKQ